MLIDLLYSQVMPVIAFQVVLLGIIISNVFLLHRARRHSAPAKFPPVSILVPARNEEKRIAACVQSLLAQDYPDFELLVLDDRSEDATRQILTSIAAGDARLRVLPGSPTPPGMLGKNWACAQLAKEARGELLLFTDADTIHHPGALRVMVTALLGEDADLLSGYPRQETQTWGERLLVPFFTWASVTFIPLWLAYRARLTALSSAVGQVLLIRRAAYQSTGGHLALGASAVDDLELARRITAAKRTWRMVYLADQVTCRMYSSGRKAYAGFTKNYFAAFGYRLLPYLFVFSWMLLMFLAPLALLAAAAAGLAPASWVDELAVCVGLSVLVWWIPYSVAGIPFWLALFYPANILANSLVAARSLRLSLSGQITWKDRPLERPRWKWL